ncbi:MULTISPECIES: DUF1385 domain-containing protein [unclassified Candidatus Frackibacter]|uniref:DUF1385 domain-containing protein n=1 Tax=unclassified Candidatus Frackibacter TaxID=2648818 RepID=UPI00079C66C3|nr:MULTISPECIES: DUF1385 domain-containing protein [unclassified Candidatus Frackibacter]KXS40345.1 MAG: hypothetical protein AWU54_2014 [Candidatus Frackibacter sp. T328-2]
MMRIGGRAYKNGVRLFGQRYSVKAYYEDDQLKYEIGENTLINNKLYLLAKKIPFLRGMISIIFSLIFFLKEAIQKPKKFWPILVIIIINIGLEIYFRLQPDNMIGSSLFITVSPYMLPIYLFGIACLVMLLRMTILKEIFKFHGAEHKAVNYYESNYQGRLSSHSRLARRCGTNLVVFYLLVVTILETLGITFNVYLESLIAIGIAYEIILISPQPILSIPYLVQRFTTIEPSPKHLNAAKTALKILINMEKGEKLQIIA